MPSCNGITLGVISQRGLQAHPEFKHPDSSQYSSPQLDNSPRSEISSSKSDRILGRYSTVAIYIPSVSEARFWLHYNISEAATFNSPWFYFKLLMNGRHITSWGANSITQAKGQIMRGLFDPSERWNFRGEDGVIVQKGGCEVRSFFFAKEDESSSAAEEGGLIEVLVFRARGRKRRMPEPHDFRSQDHWGIVMPTGGLLENPEDAKFYDWHLRDSKDRPFATFQFHYRSWSSLIASQLIPIDHDRKLLPASPSLLSLNGHPRELESQLKEDDEDQGKICVDKVELKAEEDDESISSTTSDTPWMTTVFDDKPDPGAKNPDKPAELFNIPRTPSSNSLRKHLNTASISKHTEVAHDTIHEDDCDKFYSEFKDPVKRPPRPVTPGTRAAQWAEVINRPLPEIPDRMSSLNYGRSRGRSRSSTVTSNAVSITPSLRSYFDRDTNSPEPPVIGIASVIHVIASTFGLNKDPKNKDRTSTSNEESEAQIICDNEAGPSIIPSQRPQGGVFDISNITLRKHHRSSPTKPLSIVKKPPIFDFEFRDSPKLSSPNAANNESYYNDTEAELSAIDNENATPVSVSESEWMCRTPSPVHNNRADHVWSPNIAKPAIRNSLEDVMLITKAEKLSVRAPEELEDSSMLVRGDEKVGVKMRSGNWI